MKTTLMHSPLGLCRPRTSIGLGVAMWALPALLLCLPVSAQRLPDVVHPLHYSLELTPDLTAATFTGEETIDVDLTKPSNAITLNAAQLKFKSASAKVGGTILPATVTLDPAEEQATLHFSKTLPAGTIALSIKYEGILNSELRGFYLSKTATRRYAVTQFEATDARRAFPCFDEPAWKATFDIQLVVGKGDTAISNTNIVSDTPGPASDEHTLRFARTPKMSTYLVAFLVGDFQCLSGKSDGIPIRVCATPGHVQQGGYALSAAEFFLHFYNNYFGLKYPLPKLDLIAIPDFEAGAMENFGAITFREQALLLDPNAASVAAHKVVAVDVAHEMAHQWFGDAVTMRWWDNIWLNEGFATWMENKAAGAWKPEWHMSEDVAAGLNGTLNLDAAQWSRAIRAPANTPDEINQMFDGITYGKAAAVLGMVEHYVGEETFRKGVQKYLAAHWYGNATAEDFWNTQTTVSRKPVDKIMDSLVAQPGEPLLTFSAVQGGKVQVTQQRFFLNPKMRAPELTWTLPVCMKHDASAPECEILDQRSEMLSAPSGDFFFGDAEGRGYYRSLYSANDYQKLVDHAETALDPEERIALLGSEWALTIAEKADIGDFLKLVNATRDDHSVYVIRTSLDAIDEMDQKLISTPEEHQLLAAWVRKTFSGTLGRMGPPNAADSPEQKELRAELFWALGTLGEDYGVAAQAKHLLAQYLANPSSVDATLAAAALAVAAQNGDEELFDQIQHVSETTASPQLHSQTLIALALFRNPKLIERTLAYAASGKVKNQDSGRLIAVELSNRATRDVAWQFLQNHWTEVQAQLTAFTTMSVVGSTENFCSAADLYQVSTFFAGHPVPVAQAALKQAKNGIGDCIEFRSAQGGPLERWLRNAETQHLP